MLLFAVAVAVAVAVVGTFEWGRAFSGLTRPYSILYKRNLTDEHNFLHIILSSGAPGPAPPSSLYKAYRAL